MKRCCTALSILLLPALLSVLRPIDGRGRTSSVSRINRYAWVTRHNPTIHTVAVDVPLTVGNGGFAFTADITGLQTFAERYYRRGIPVETLARWAPGNSSRHSERRHMDRPCRGIAPAAVIITGSCQWWRD